MPSTAEVVELLPDKRARQYVAFKRELAKREQRELTREGLGGHDTDLRTCL